MNLDFLSTSNERSNSNSNSSDPKEKTFNLKKTIGLNALGLNSNSENNEKVTSQKKINNLFGPNSNIENNFERSETKDEMFKKTMEKKFNQEKKYLLKKKKILADKNLSPSEKKQALEKLSKNILNRKGYYSKSSYNEIGKSLKYGLKVNNIDSNSRQNVSTTINELKTNISELKHKLLYGFLNENEIDEEFNNLIERYKKNLKKRQNIDFQTELKNKDKKEKIRDLNDELRRKNNFLIELKKKGDKNELINYYIEEIIPLKNDILKNKYKVLEMIQDYNNENEFYLYKND